MCNNAAVDNEPLAVNLTKAVDVIKRANDFVKAVDLAKKVKKLGGEEYIFYAWIIDLLSKLAKVGDLSSKAAYLVTALGEANKSGDSAKAVDLTKAVELANKATNFIKIMDTNSVEAVNVFNKIHSINKHTDLLIALELARTDPLKVQYLQNEITKVKVSLGIDDLPVINDEILKEFAFVESDDFTKALDLANKASDSANGAEGNFAFLHRALVLVPVLVSVVVSSFFDM
jgi:hypothetical protein